MSRPPSAAATASAASSSSSANERTVTDPVTHIALPVHDKTLDELQAAMSTHPLDSNAASNSTMDGVVESETRLNWVNEQLRQTKIQIAYVAGAASLVGGGSVLILSRILGRYSTGWTGWFAMGSMCCVVSALAGTSVMRLWDAQTPTIRLAGEEDQLRKSDAPESAIWLNALLASLWPIVNPSLFISVSDMLEDALQASLPKLIHGVRVADIGQGSEPLRVLGIRSLSDIDRTSAEQGDFVNLEVALAYHARSGGKSLKARSANPHILMEFLIKGGIPIPVWIELTGILATARMRIQLMPNPPFLAGMMLTLVGQPKVTLKCTPLAKGFMNVMDVPGLSNWLHQSIDAAIGAYVAPRSLSLDLKTMLSGIEQMDTASLGVVIVVVKCASGFKDGDGGKFWESSEEKRGDPYVTIGWGKWGKPVWSSRVIENEGNPCWEEVAALLVGPSEMNAKEKLRLQLWDSDRGAADDMLGTVEIDLHEIMQSHDTLNRMMTRTDPFTDPSGKPMPGELSWECGYFAKTTLDQHLVERGIDIEQFKRDVQQHTQRELREAESLQQEEQEKIEKQKQADMKDRGDELIAGSPPTDLWPSGILAIQIEQIQELVVPKARSGVAGDENEDMPSAYCTVILNHQRVYRTRTKLKTNKPFFAAGTERYIKDWRNTSLLIAVRDSRLHEMDPLIGVVELSLPAILKSRSQVSGSYPLGGGIGFGRVQVSLVFRSIQAQLPRPLIGWDIGTLDIQPHARSVADGPPLPADLSACRLVLRTQYGRGKFHAHPDGGWAQKRGKPVRLAVKRRFGECLLVEFRHHASLGPSQTVAFSTLWLKDIPDSEDTTISVPVWRNAHGSVLARARVNAETPPRGAEQLGNLQMTVRFCQGLSAYHKPLADHDPNYADVIRALDAAEETGESSHDPFVDSESSEDSDSQDEDPEDGDNPKKSNVLSELKEYKNRKEDLHRKHRGLMQWGAARKAAWVGHHVEAAADKVEQKIKGKFTHHQMEQGMDVEA